jgi:4-alpha-glucanotransferase
MNTPSVDGGNWRWRFDERQLNADLAKKLALLAEVTDRLPQPFANQSQDSFFA